MKQVLHFSAVPKQQGNCYFWASCVVLSFSSSILKVLNEFRKCLDHTKKNHKDRDLLGYLQDYGLDLL